LILAAAAAAVTPAGVVNYGFEVSCRRAAVATEHTCFRRSSRREVEGAETEMAPLRRTSAVRDRLVDTEKNIQR